MAGGMLAGAGCSQSSPDLKENPPTSIRYFLKALENSPANGFFPYFLLCLEGGGEELQV